MTHAAMDPDARRAAGISDQLLRLSIGLESADDLSQDLLFALDQVATQLQAASTAQVAC
jgi:cystathionine gamma-synthase